MRLIHHKTALHSTSETTTEESACAAAVGASKVGPFLWSPEQQQQQNNSDVPSSPCPSPKRHRRRIETFLANHHLSPQPRKERHQRRRANSWHGGNKLYHLFHHHERPVASLHDTPKLQEAGASEHETEEQVIMNSHQSQTSNIMQRVDEEEPTQQMAFEKQHTATTLTKPTKGNAFSHFFKAVEDFLFQRRPMHPHEKQHISSKKDVVLLYGCHTAEEHYQKVKDLTERISHLHGKEGLKAIDLEYRLVHCDEHKQGDESGKELGAEPVEDELGNSAVPSLEDDSRALCCTSESIVSTLLDATVSLHSADASSMVPTEPSSHDSGNTFLINREKLPCLWCMQRLFHAPSGLEVDEENRKQFCADGDMYEEVTRLCQEYAQDLMCQEGNLEWHEVEAISNHKEAIRMMVSKGHRVLQGENNGADTENRNRPTLLIATGRGKVRAGIFSRMHMMCSGLESATAIPLVREAAARGINVIVLDPNVHGDKDGFVTFTKCMDHYYHKMQDSLQETGLYVLSHSASGGHMARYLLDKSNEVLAHFHAVAFTDSTHNIQWTKKKAANTPTHNPRLLFTVAKSITDEQEEGSTSPLQDFLQSEKCVYFRCAKVRRDALELSIHPAGEPVQTDAFWTHRFGKIRTLWAGTDEHSLTNWYSHAKIWEHFDSFLRMERAKNGLMI